MSMTKGQWREATLAALLDMAERLPTKGEPCPCGCRRDVEPLNPGEAWVEDHDADPRPESCCGKCPSLARGGYDCTCEGNPRCESSKKVEAMLVQARAEGRTEEAAHHSDMRGERDALAARLAAVEALAERYEADARSEGYGGELWSTTGAAIRAALEADQ